MPTGEPWLGEGRDEPRAADRAPTRCCRLSARAQGPWTLVTSLLGDQAYAYELTLPQALVH